MTDSNTSWHDVFVQYGLDAATGRYFKGVIHNLNGVGQAFSMQTELLGMMFPQVDQALNKIGSSDSLEDAKKGIAELREMLARRAKMAKHLDREVRIMLDIMQRVTVRMDESRDPSSIHPYALEELLRVEIEFMNADSFFKHKVNKVLNVADDLPFFSGFAVEIHQIVNIMLENALQAMMTVNEESFVPEAKVAATRNRADVLIQIADNGAGVPYDDPEKIFKPFTTSREGRLGMGLYLAKIMADRFGGNISYESVPGETIFRLTIPSGEVWH